MSHTDAFAWSTPAIIGSLSRRLESTWTDEESTCTPVRERFEDAPALTKQDLYKHIQARKHVEQMRKDLEDKEGKVNNLRYVYTYTRSEFTSIRIPFLHTGRSWLSAEATSVHY